MNGTSADLIRKEEIEKEKSIPKYDFNPELED
jgi:hypothetical protein